MMDWNLIFRLIIAGLLGGLVGVERELRAKEAGLRTHFVVALGSALFMIISQYAFGDLRYDASRVAAQVVSGIGFIGAGVIIFQKNVVRGVTTAAGLWVVAAIGLACGAGMWSVAVAATLLTMMCLEAVHFLHLHYGEKAVTLTADCSQPEQLKELLARFKDAGISVESYSMDKGMVTLRLRMRLKRYMEDLPAIVSHLSSVTIEMQ